MREPSERDDRRPVSTAPRVAAIALVSQAVAVHWLDAATNLTMAQRAAGELAVLLLGLAQLASLAVVVRRALPRWAIIGMLAWAVGWLARTVDVVARARAALGGPIPVGWHQLTVIDPALVQLVATAGGLVIGAALVTAIGPRVLRHSAIVLLLAHAVLGVVAAIHERQIARTIDYPIIIALRGDLEIAEVIASAMLAGVLWLYWRQLATREGMSPHS